MLFTSPNPPLLKDKLSKRQKVWSSFPHLLLRLSAIEVLREAQGQVFGSVDNVGRKIQAGEVPEVKTYSSYLRIKREKVSEILVPADSLANRVLNLNALRSIICFSDRDIELIKRAISHFKSGIDVELKAKGRYIEGQRSSPGADFIRCTEEFFDSVFSEDEHREETLLKNLARRCFD